MQRSAPKPGQIVRVRSRRYLVLETILPSTDRTAGDARIRLACVDDDAQGQELDVFWEREIDAQVLPDSPWEILAQRGFDEPKQFSAYLNTVRWNCVTSTDAELFQSPYRAGIQIKAYQLEPLRKALRMPRIGLFIADDVGLGKTIEAGLILREMLIRQRVRRVVIACPPSVVQQWREEMEARFGLTLTIYDREFVARKRRERGYSINPWNTHSRFIISHALLRDESYAAGLRDWLAESTGGSMLILDEAHNAAPASGSRYAVDSKLTKVVREIADRFEHKLFLSATPHNGHSNSFAALLEMLDPQRFCRGVPIAGSAGRQLLDSVMVRRLKRDLQEAGDSDFPTRHVVPVRIEGLPPDAPELELARLLQRYRELREQRLARLSKRQHGTAMLVITSLQKRLLSSIEAFARTLRVHRRAIDHLTTTTLPSPAISTDRLGLLREAPGSDDDRAELSDAELLAEDEAQITAATTASTEIPTPEELTLLDRMVTIAEAYRHQPDPRIAKILDWIRDHQCPNLGQPGAEWVGRQRLLIFTEYVDTKNYLKRQLAAAIAQSDHAADRIAVFQGGQTGQTDEGEDLRESIKRAFNTDPTQHPLRILIATDAAREGVNLQSYCADLFHFDIPWNPSRMEQRNGRIDRKLQPAKVVYCRYFLFTQRTEDRVLDVLVQKTQRIREELGSLPPVIEKRSTNLLDRGILPQTEQQLITGIGGIDHDPDRDPDANLAGPSLECAKAELEGIRPAVKALREQEEQLQNILQKSQRWLGLDDRQFRDTLSTALQALGAPPLEPIDSTAAAQDPLKSAWRLPDLDRLPGADASWAATLDTLRPPKPPGQKLWDWRREAPVRPVVFADPGRMAEESVHLHLEHRVVQRLLGRFLAQGFAEDQLSRAAVCLTSEPIPLVITLARLLLYGDKAARLHDEVLAIGAEWRDPSLRGSTELRPLADTDHDRLLSLLKVSLSTPSYHSVDLATQQRLKQSVPRDLAELRPHLETRAADIEAEALRKLRDRGDREAESMRGLLKRLQERIRKEANTAPDDPQQLELQLSLEAERKQRAADRRYWQLRLQHIDRELETEPQQIRESYRVKASRIEPVGIVYLWPRSS